MNTTRAEFRTQKIVSDWRTAGIYLSGPDKLAARNLFSVLCHLERLAELAAERGDGVENQLEDEKVHRWVFQELAEIHGGLEPCPAPVQKLIEYLGRMEGEMSLATLNLVAESWLDTVFHHLAKCGLADNVFESIEEDEARHTYGALQAAKPDSWEVLPVMRDLEKLLMEISMCGEFMLPMAWFLGPAGVADMGLGICAAHERACKHLDVTPDLHDLEVSCRSARFLDRTAPKEWPMNEWERLKLANWKQPAPQLCFVDAETDTISPVKLQAQVIQALGRLLAREPELRRVVRNDKLYMTDHPVVGLRALYDEDRVLTLFISRPEKHSTKKIVGMLNKQLKRYKAKPYEPYDGPISIVPHLEQLFPPSRCNVVVSYNGGHGGLFGVGPLSHLEGIPCTVTIGEPRYVPVRPSNVARLKAKEEVPNGGFSTVVGWRRVVTVCVQMDHRIGDGRHVGAMANGLAKELSIIQKTERR